MTRIFTFVLLTCSFLANGQTALEYKMDGSEKGQKLSVVLSEISTKDSIRFYFIPEWIEAISFEQSYQGQTLQAALNAIFEGTELSYVAMYSHVVVIVKDPTQALLRRNAIQTAVKENRKIEEYSFGEIGTASNKSEVVISGIVTDSETDEPMPFSNIQIGDSQLGTTTDATGAYSITLKQGANVLNVSFVEYDRKAIDLEAYEDGVINIEIEKSSTILDEVVIESRVIEELTTSRIGKSQLVIKDIKRAPAFLGEADLIKQIQVLPGVTTVGEAASGFNVRGGSVDQNLILYDGLPVFNSSHVFGFLTSFNPETIRDVSFYRGGVPAKYGGRVSSVLNIESTDGDYQEWKVKAGIGMIASNVVVSGPLQKDKTAMVASFRSTYSDWLVKAIRTDYADLSKSSVSFYDTNLKLTHLLSNETKLSVSGYASNDSFRLVGDSTYQWGSLQISARLDHQFSPQLEAEFTAGVSNYGYSVLNKDFSTASKLAYQINTTVLKSGFRYQRDQHNFDFGWQLLGYRFSPGELSPESAGSNARSISLDKQFSIENAIYIADEYTVNQKLTIEVGLRIPLFMSFGAAQVNVYEPNKPREIETITDVMQFGKGELIKAYAGIEPRISLRGLLSTTSSLKFGYHRMYQFLHLVTNTASVTPIDIWQPSGYYFEPQRADQLSIGYFKDFKEKAYGASTEAFYKHLNNIIDFKDGAQLILNDHLETDLLQGKGKSYGIETAFFKKTGRLTGSLNYTYSRAFREIKGPTEEESISRGNRYPAGFDQPHIINLSWKYDLSSRHFFTGNFTYHTGRPTTIPLSAFALENNAVAYFSDRNQFRIPDYHRMDIALVIEGNHKRKKVWDGTWVISVYNVYARRNPYSVFFLTTETLVPRPYQLSIIGTIFPSLSYKLEF